MGQCHFAWQVDSQLRRIHDAKIPLDGSEQERHARLHVLLPNVERGG